MAKKAVSTKNTTLKAGANKAGLAQLCKIKSYPDLGGAPEQLETTDLEDETQTFVDGVQSLDALEFTSNYTKESYEQVNESAGTEQKYQLDFGEAGADGTFSWTGTHSVRVNGGEVNGVREMTITCTPSSKISPTPVEDEGV